jgi:hypothetical protein
MSEKFILNAVFKHETKPIDEQAMRDYLAFIKEELDPESEFWLENIWYKIDDYMHGSISFYASEEGYQEMIGRIEAQRNIANEFNGVTMVHEFKGTTFAVLTEV